MTGTGTGEHAKTWQALATPTGANSTSQSVYDSWMEGGVTPTSPNGYGTHIPDPSWTSTVTNGFDAYSYITSIKTFNSGSQTFASIGNTSIPLCDKNGYFLFVRGDRSVTDIATQAVPTILRSKGALFQPHSGYNPSSVSVPGNQKYALVGNPYASAIDLNFMYTHSGYFSNLDHIFVVWDVSIPGTQGYGGYQYLDATNNFKPTSPGPGGTTNYYQTNVSYREIQSGQAFFVKSAGSSTGSVSFSEDVKSSNSRIVTKGIYNNESSNLWAGLYSSTGICDGNSISFGNNYSDEIGVGDAHKLPNPGENFMILKEKGVALAIEKRQPVRQSDSIFYAFNNLRQMAYQLKFAPVNLWEEGLEASLIDNYMHNKTALSLTDSSFINFTVDANKASYENRFVLVFERKNKLHAKQVSSTDIPSRYVNDLFVIYPNPVENKMVRVVFCNSAKGKYVVQMVNNAGQTVHKIDVNISKEKKIVIIKPENSIIASNYTVIITDSRGKKSVKEVFVK